MSNTVTDAIREYGPLVAKIAIVLFALVGVNSAFMSEQPEPERTGTIACETDNGVSLISYGEYEEPQNLQDEIDLCERKLGVFSTVTDAYDFGIKGDSNG